MGSKIKINLLSPYKNIKNNQLDNNILTDRSERSNMTDNTLNKNYSNIHKNKIILSDKSLNYFNNKLDKQNNLYHKSIQNNILQAKIKPESRSKSTDRLRLIPNNISKPKH